MFAYDASLFHRACPVWVAIVCMVMIRATRVVGIGSFNNGHCLVKARMPLCFGKQLVDPAAIPTTELFTLQAHLPGRKLALCRTVAYNFIDGFH